VALAEARVEAFDGVSFQAWENRIETEHDNMRAALAWSLSTKEGVELGLRLAGSLVTFWNGNGRYWSEGRGWLESALAHVDTEGVDNIHLRARILRGLGLISTFQGNYEAAQVHLTNSRKLFQESGDVFWSAAVLERLGWLARERGDSATARLQLEEALATLRKLGDKEGIFSALNTLGEVLVMQEDVEGATRLLEESLTLSKEQGDLNSSGWALNHLGHAAQIQGEYERATRLHLESLPFFRESGPEWIGIPWAHQGLGETALAQGDATRAATHLGAALSLFHIWGDRAGVSWCLAGLAGVEALDEEPERAAWLWGAAESLRQSIGTREAPASHATHERLKAEVRKQLGEAAFNAKWAEGQAASMEQAIAEAMS
jgi:tetratricopeptide (TPR) repeat protein